MAFFRYLSRCDILTYMQEKGWIALDIDGTTTADVHEIPKEVCDYLHTLSNEGWKIFFITGRLFFWALGTVSSLEFPFYFGTQNGADIFEMPSKKLLSQTYLNSDILAFLDREYAGLDKDYLIYSGFENGDTCYYRPRRFAEDVKTYLSLLEGFSPISWKAFDTFDFDKKITFPLIKCFGTKEEMDPLYEKLKQRTDVQISMIRDPLSVSYYLILVTDAGASKGTALERIRNTVHSSSPLIAAGDDFNDLPMLRHANVKIVMETAPEDLKKHADIIAPPATECGLIPALKEAIESLS